MTKERNDSSFSVYKTEMSCVMEEQMKSLIACLVVLVALALGQWQMEIVDSMACPYTSVRMTVVLPDSTFVVVYTKWGLHGTQSECPIYVAFNGSWEKEFVGDSLTSPWDPLAIAVNEHGDPTVFYISLSQQALMMSSRIGPDSWQTKRLVPAKMKRLEKDDFHCCLIDGVFVGDEFYLAYNTIISDSECFFCVYYSGDGSIDTVEASHNYYDCPRFRTLNGQMWLGYQESREQGGAKEKLASLVGSNDWQVFSVDTVFSGVNMADLAIGDDGQFYVTRDRGWFLEYTRGVPGSSWQDIALDTTSAHEGTRAEVYGNDLYVLSRKCTFDGPLELWFYEPNHGVAERLDTTYQFPSHAMDLKVDENGVHVVWAPFNGESYSTIRYYWRTLGIQEREEHQYVQRAGATLMRFNKLPADVELFDAMGRRVRQLRSGVYYLLNKKGGEMRRVILIQ